MVLTPEAGSVKTRQARIVPIHPHLLDQGFLAFVAARGPGPLFYSELVRSRRTKNSPTKQDPMKTRRPKSWQVRRDLGAWVRKLVTDPGVSPSHSWRHSFKQIAERSGISERVSDAITGHAPASVGRSYGKPNVADMEEALKKFPRYLKDL
jgi:integrase